MTDRDRLRPSHNDKPGALHPQAPRSTAAAARLALMVAAGLAGASCMTQQELATQLGRSLSQAYVPKVVACWETEFEAAEFRGEYRAVVDLTVNADGSLSDVDVARVESTATASSPDAPDGSRTLGVCLASALSETNVTPSGWAPPAPLRVRGFVFAFTDASAELRAAAKAEGSPLLIGPRSNRCMGLYAFSPPREAALLDADMAEAHATADRKAEVDPDSYARALQRLYDLALELRRRLEVDAANADLGDESHARTLERRDEAARLARDTGESIGCEPPLDF